MNRLKIVLAGGLLAGLLDIVDAMVFFGVRSHVPPMRIGQSIASGLMGDMAYNTGWAGAIVGFFLHFVIAVLMAAVFFVVAKRSPVVGRHPVAFAPVYGLLLWAVMTYVVLPLSGFKGGHHPHFPPEFGPQLANALFAHIALVALPIAVFVRRALKAA